MTALDNIVDVTITKDTASVSRAGFGTPAVLTYHDNFPEYTRSYTSAAEMLDGAVFATTDRAYKMVTTLFSQNPKPSRVVVGRRITAPQRIVTLTPRAPHLALTEYAVTIDAEEITFTTGAAPVTAADITAGMVAAVNLGGQDVVATDLTGTMTIEQAATPGGAPAAGVPFVIDLALTNWGIVDSTPDASVANDIVRLLQGDNDWYGLCADFMSAAEITLASTAIEALPRIYIADSQDSDIIEAGAGGIAQALETAGVERTAVIYHPNPDPSPAAAWLGKQLPTDPGSTTWKFKTLATIPASGLSTGQAQFARNRNANYYILVAGINITTEGVMGGGEYIDVVRFIDWLTARIQENVYRVLAVSPKIGFTDLGIQTIVNEVEGTLKLGASVGGIDGEQAITVTAPRAADVATNTKANRTLPDIDFTATLAGAIHKTIINGRLTL